MDVEQVVERMRILAGHGDWQALGALCGSPAVKAIVRVSLCASMGAYGGVAEVLAGVPEREIEDVPLSETEIEPFVAGRLAEQGIETLGQLRRSTDAKLLLIPHISAERIYLLRAVERKYFDTQTRRRDGVLGPAARGKARG